MLRRRAGVQPGAQSIEKKEAPRHSSGIKKRKISMEVLDTVGRSYFVRFCALLLVVAAGIVSGLRFSLVVVSLIVAVVFAFYHWKKVAFECILLGELLLYSLGVFDWYNVVDDNLILGAIPIQEIHADELQRMNLSLVVSVVEPFELEAVTLGGRPITGEFWKKIGVDHRILPSPDFLPPHIDVLADGAKLLDEYLREGKRVYVHCKSGRGRSASVIMAYFCRYRYVGMDLPTIHSKLQARRKAVFKFNSPQIRQMEAFVQSFRPKF